MILHAADRCVKCGLCLPHCPTYGQLQDEGDSPRGRIALMQGLASGDLALTPRLQAHLDRCLGCRACERVCPSAVEYEQLLNATRTLIVQRQRPGLRRRLLWRWLTHLLSSDTARRRSYALARLLHLSGLRALGRVTGITRLLGLARGEQLLPRRLPRARPLPRRVAARGPRRGHVALFTGCSGDTLDNATLHAALRLLSAAGFDVHVPSGQTCCGALHAHSGQRDSARDMAAANLAAFAGLPDSLDAIVYVASGCGSTLHDYPAQAGRAFTAPVMELCDFLHRRADERLSFRPREGSAVLHRPCSLANDDAALALLGRIPQFTVTALAGRQQCCGAAGSYMLAQPQLSDTFREQTLQRLAAAPRQPDLLLTSNIGCALHLAAGLRAPGREIAVRHPAVLLAEQLVEG